MTSTLPSEDSGTSAAGESSSLLERNEAGEMDVVSGTTTSSSSQMKGSIFCRPACSWTVAAIFAVLAILLMVHAIVTSPLVRLGTCPDDDHPSVVLFIGDGFGPQMTSLVRLFFNPEVKGDEPFTALNMPESQCQLTFTQTRSASSYVTDSAASGTALATGYKTTNYYLGVRLDPRDPKYAEEAVPVGNVLEAAKMEGYVTGVVVTSAVTHATPGAFTAHVEDRQQSQLIALQQATLQKDYIDLFIGGGRVDFENTTRDDGRDLVGEMRKNGYSVAYTKEELMKVDKLPLLSLLGSEHLPYKIDRDNTEEAHALPSLQECVEKAIKLMRATGKPFFLMVEGSKIDFAAHTNDLATAVYEAKDYLDALNSTITDAVKHGDTIVMATSDHDTGGLSINKGVNMDLLHKISASSEFMSSVMEEGNLTNEIIKGTIEKYTTIDNITDEEAEEIRNAESRPNIISEIVSERLSVKWGAHDHTDTNVMLYSCFGGWKRSEACKFKEEVTNWFPVFNDNTDIPKFISNHSHTSLSKATERAVKVFTGHTTPTRQVRTAPVMDSIDKAYHTKDNM